MEAMDRKEFVKDVFGTWIKKLRAAIPAELPLRA